MEPNGSSGLSVFSDKSAMGEVKAWSSMGSGEEGPGSRVWSIGLFRAGTLAFSFHILDFLDEGFKEDLCQGGDQQPVEPGGGADQDEPMCCTGVSFSLTISPGVNLKLILP